MALSTQMIAVSISARLIKYREVSLLLGYDAHPLVSGVLCCLENAFAVAPVSLIAQ